MSPVWSYVVSAAILCLSLIGLHVLLLSNAKKSGKGEAGRSRRRGMLGLIIGKDFRTSTSKTQMAAWTMLLAFAMLSLVLQHIFELMAPEVDGAKYLLLLGIPAAAAASAKVVTTKKVTEGTITKKDGTREKAEGPLKGLANGAAELIGNDVGEGDLHSAQYLIFNLVAMVYFLVAFVSVAPDKLPDIPNVLFALTGASAAAYVAQKAVEKQKPAITAVYPTTVKPGDLVTIRGTGFLEGRTALSPADDSVAVMAGGRMATLDGTKVLSDTKLEVVAPQGEGLSPVIVISPNGGESEAFDAFTIEPASVGGRAENTGGTTNG